MYESAKADRISQANHQAFRSVFTNSLVLLISLIIFIFHWTWMRRLAREYKVIPA